VTARAVWIALPALVAILTVPHRAASVNRPPSFLIKSEKWLL
jgi:hypothetical protein